MMHLFYSTAILLFMITSCGALAQDIQTTTEELEISLHSHVMSIRETAMVIKLSIINETNSETGEDNTSSRRSYANAIDRLVDDLDDVLESLVAINLLFYPIGVERKESHSSCTYLTLTIEDTNSAIDKIEHFHSIVLRGSGLENRLKRISNDLSRYKRAVRSLASELEECSL